ncbi:MAG: bifunctional adenosylcobinamide kinase/adenosylcobinamide-phosphate guanylyltransferase, partial [Solirubrobacterales bacterium]|nr:bifunctional adenosylcobinamide kinase/adenosylcobinamide-phosphate guanylyltransferase [Solirubrobacterales bacterium]
MSLTLVLGGTRSGKSAHAERLAVAAGGPVRYVATADPGDGSMDERIRAHVARRPAGWETVVAAGDLAATVAGTTLIDGLGTWIGGVLHRGEGDVAVEIERLIDAARQAAVIVVAEEAGQGMLPLDALSRRWLDLLGESVQRLSDAAERVDYVVAGRSIALSGPPVDVADLRRHGDRDVRPGDADHAVTVLAGGPPEWLRAALDVALDRYPDDTEARTATAMRHGRRPDEVVVTNGAAEALWLLGPALRPSLAACVHPGFTEAEAGLRAHRVPVIRVQRDPDEGFALNPTAVPDAADLVVLGNPGFGLDPAHAVLALRRPGRVIVVDEAFMEMVPGEAGSLAGESLPDVIVVRSLTKVLSVPGLRVGYALASAEMARRFEAVRPPWSANVLALATLTAAVAHTADLAALAERVGREREDLCERLAGIDSLRVWPSPANYVLVEVSDGPAVVAALREQGRIV